MADELLFFNGIDGTTGQYLLPGVTAAELARIALGERIDPAHLRELKRRHERGAFPTLGTIAGVDATNLASAGWGVVFPQGGDPAIEHALRPLLDRRRAQAGRRYRAFRGDDGYRPGDSKTDFLVRHGHGPAGAVDPDRVPYYLLLVGDPEQIPYRFQYLLDVDFAVGRIAFDSVEAYAAYARSVVRAEDVAPRRPKTAAFFGVRNPDDPATQLSADELVAPLAGRLARTCPDWTVHALLGEDAMRARLQQLLGGSETPRLLLTASHGMGFPHGHALQRAHQGALLCQDWSGPVQQPGPVPRDAYLAAPDVLEEADLSGLIALVFACFGAGTPHLDDFAHHAFTNPKPLAPRAFVAALPQRMLGNPAGGALAVVAHVERAWTYSFAWPGAGAQRQVFESALQQLAQGVPVGHALEFFNARYASLSTLISSEIEYAKSGAKVDERNLAGLWTALNDARSYVVVGDPAVRLP
jgi:hypothetical protein